MTHVRWQDLAAKQDDLVARWQMLEAGLELWRVDELLHEAGWRRMFDGVYAVNHAPLTGRQWLRAATVTAPGTYLSFASAADWWGVRPRRLPFVVVTRAGSGGPRRHGALLVCRSSRLVGNVATCQDLPITTPERTLIDLAGVLPAREVTRAVREAIRLRRTTPARLAGVLYRHRGARGTRLLRELAARYAHLRLDRSRSDAESFAQELIAAAGLPVPQVNVVVAGEEADLVWADTREIVEIDGPQFHLFAEEDARKQQRWEAAGWKVSRVPSDDVFHAPHRLLALVPRPSVRPAGR